MLFKSVIIIVMLLAGIYWLYDAVTNLSKRRKDKLPEPTLVSYARGTFLISAIIVLIKVFNVGILLLLLVLTVISFFVWLIDRLFLRKRRAINNAPEPLVIDYARSLMPIFIIVLVIRSFIAQPFHVPTGSLEPTVMPNDFVLVLQYPYGLRSPVGSWKIIPIGEPKRGDIVVFRHPLNPNIDLIKRAIGLPGDHIVYKNKVLYINGKMASQTFVKNTFDIEPDQMIPSKEFIEDLGNRQHSILVHDEGGEVTAFDVTVPQGYYFMMGDNRDNSADSRFWGFAPEENIIGKAVMIFFGWDHGPNFKRIGIKL